MEFWDIMNASMKIAARCNNVFSKNFVYRINGSKELSELWIDACPNGYVNSSPYHIHMVVNYDKYTMEVYFNFRDLYDFSKCEEERMKYLAVSLGKGIAKRFAIIGIKKDGILFTFDENLSFPYKKNHYEYINDGVLGKLDSDFPLLNYMSHEYEAEFLLYYTSGLRGLSELKKNGKIYFEESQYLSYQHRLYIRVEKKKSAFDVHIEDHNFLNIPYLYTLKTMSLLGNYTSLSIVPTLPLEDRINPYMEFYFSIDDNYMHNNDVHVNRIRNYGILRDDLQKAFMAICDKMNMDKTINWNNAILF